ncbi:hypothetical protein Syun_007463 [Stephania yunnanensis]|uniref:Uncharacterized protein n=1 Tax=Stephania yunnanensis TaxID=152371 RepID=A0AAP0PYJ2_9MAGN
MASVSRLVSKDCSLDRNKPDLRFRANLGAGGRLCTSNGSSGAGDGFEVTKFGHGRVALIGFPRYGDAASDDRVYLALPRLCDPDPVAPAFGGLRLLGHLSILFPLTLILVILLDFTYLGSSISCLTERRAADE